MIVTIGEVIVDFLVDEPGSGFREALHLRGPFPAGAPAIFADQVARLGHASAIISCVGNDDFGTLVRGRLQADGVDVGAIAVDEQAATGSAFVRYHADGERDFLFNIRHSAAGATRLTAPALELLRRATHLHVMGSSLFSPELVDVTFHAVDLVKARGGGISFDPNARKELLTAPHMRAALDAMLGRCDIFLPGSDELTLFTNAESEQAACRELLDRDIREIVVKSGARGARYYDEEQTLRIEPLHVEQIDATGAGDCFGAAFVTCRVMGKSPHESLRYANAAGALAVTQPGAMAGSTFAALEDLLCGGS